MKLILITVAAFLVSKISGTTPDNVSSRLMVHIPHKLFKAEGYKHREALFGTPPYGGSISANVYKSKTLLCDPNKDQNAAEEGWISPFILMVNRGDCSFVKKVRNAQRMGAAAVIIADNTCLCGDDTCEVPKKSCQKSEPIMSDDGSGSDISIPSMLMLKVDADKIKIELAVNNPVQMEMAWNLPTPDDRVEYDMWTVPTDAFIDHDFVSNFKDVVLALGKSAYYTPHMYIHDGKKTECLGAGTKDEDGASKRCHSLCTNEGRYCATDPDGDLEKGISGADVVKESLRRLCIWENYGTQDGIGEKYWDYVIEFTKSCNKPDKFMKDTCVEKAYKKASIDSYVIEECMNNSGGLLEGKNKILMKQIETQKERGIVIIPTVVVNNAALRGALTVSNVFTAICAGFAPGTKPDICKKCEGCNDPNECLEGKGVCAAASSSRRGVSMVVFMFVVSSILSLFVGFGYWYYKTTKKEMQDEVRDLLAEYMPLEDMDDANENDTKGKKKDEIKTDTNSMYVGALPSLEDGLSSSTHHHQIDTPAA